MSCESQVKIEKQETVLTHTTASTTTKHEKF